MSGETHAIANRLIRELSDTCRDRLLDEKWVIAPSRRAGNDWLLAVARTGQPVINGHVKTIENLALHLAAQPIAQEKRELITARQGAIVIDRVIRKRASRGRGISGGSRRACVSPRPSIGRSTR